jgi:HEPN domain-containing protein
MKPRTAEWVDKAEGDWNAARQLNRVRKDPNYDGVCFHCQQRVEKYLKARLEEAGIPFPKTHDLIKLLSLAVNVEPKWVALHPVTAVLNPYAIAYRYPGFNATKSDATDAVQSCRRVRRTVRVSLGLPA